ncbi:MAG: cytochrome c3 family protein [Planctomycetota bacterium]|jgi:hypothetical protein
MLKRFLPILGIVAVLAGAFFACNRAPIAPVRKAEGPAVTAQTPGPGAFDVVKMGRFGPRMGPMYFAHALHADLPGLDGEILPCDYCHHEVCGPPRPCVECHKNRRRGKRRGKLPST